MQDLNAFLGFPEVRKMEEEFLQGKKFKRNMKQRWDISSNARLPPFRPFRSKGRKAPSSETALAKRKGLQTSSSGRRGSHPEPDPGPGPRRRRGVMKPNPAGQVRAYIIPAAAAIIVVYSRP